MDPPTTAGIDASSDSLASAPFPTIPLSSLAAAPSKPRGVKVRKHAGSAPFNPFRPAAGSDHPTTTSTGASIYGSRHSGSEFLKSASFVCGAEAPPNPVGVESVGSHSAAFVFLVRKGNSVPDEKDASGNVAASVPSMSLDSGAYVFGRSKEGSIELGQNLPSVSSEDASAFAFGGNAAGKQEAKNGSLYGGDESRRHADMTAFVSGIGMGQSSSSNLDSLVPSRSSGGLNLGSFEGTKTGTLSPLNLNSMNSGSENEISVGSGSSHTATFVFGSCAAGLSKSNGNFSLGSDEGSFSNLSEAVKELNLQDSSKDTHAEKSKGSDQMSKINMCDNFVFGVNESTSNASDGISLSILPEKTRKLNKGGGTPSQIIECESFDHPKPGVFIFGSNAKTSSFSRQASHWSLQSDKSTSLKFAKDGNNSTIQDSGDNCNFSKNGNRILMSDTCIGHNVFVFGKGDKLSASHECSTANTAKTNTKMVNTRKEKENLTCSSEQVDAPPAQEHTSVEFTFQAAKKESYSSNSNISHLGPREIPATSTASNSSAFNSGSEHNSANISFTNLPDGMETEDIEVTTLELDESGSFEKSFTVQNCDTTFMEKGEAKGMGMNRRMGKPKKFSTVRRASSVLPVFTSEGFSGKMAPESAGGSLPMDSSPYEENSAAVKCPGEALVTSHESIDIFSHDIPSGTSKPSSVQDLLREHPVSCESGGRHVEAYDAAKTGNVAASFSAMPPGFDKETILHLEESFSFKSEDSAISQSNCSAAEADTDYLDLRTTESSDDGTGFAFASNLDNFGGSDLIFAAENFDQSPLSASRRYNRKKSRSNGNQTNPVQSLFPSAIDQAHLDVSVNQQCTASVSQRAECNKAEPKKETVSGEPTATNTASLEQEDCETWRIRGNQAYANRQLSKAEECYTHGINSFSPNEASKKSLMLCYSNRAATRMSLGRMREALSDCQRAAAMDPSFLKAQVRAANCLLALGEIEEALNGFKMCLESNHEASLDRKILVEASDGLQKAQKVSNCVLQSEELLVTKASDKVSRALQVISDALSISIYSDSLMMMKAEALLLLQRYEEVIQFCEQTQLLAERNSASLSADEQSKNIHLSHGNCSVKLWRYYLIAKSYFFLGKLEEAHQFLKKHEQSTFVQGGYDKQSEESVLLFSVTLCELLRLKAAGNEAFQAGKYSEAVEHYTAALVCNTESRPFTAICFGNRAAAYQALGQILDAIADCSLAKALDASYAKAISRRATLYELIRDYGQAANDLHRLISLLEKQLQENTSTPSEKSISISSNLNRANLKLSAMEGEARKGSPLNMYLILGIEPSSSAVDVKKAYRKAALRHHPDKAGYFLMRNENVNDALWREVADEIHRDADHLFKIIGKAYAVLSDPTMEQIRETMKKGYSMSSAHQRYNSSHSSQNDESSSQR